ncbi:MAG: preprotein translocase subunit SecE [Clostridia bacterium]|nr:preprotein translocase subunit SecE [Clostridia bacterium]
MPSKNTKKKMKNSAKSTQHKKPEELEVVNSSEVQAEETTAQEPANAVAETEVKEKIEVKEEPKQEQKAEKKTTAKKKEKKPSKIKTKTKEVASELKKVTWPTFPQVVKKTATVLVVVLVFAVVLLGIDKLLQVVYDAFIGNLK